MIATDARRACWIAMGLAALPAAVLGVFYLIGPFYLVFIALVALILARWRLLDQLVAVVASLVWLAAVIDTTIKALRPGGRGIGWALSGVLIMTSILAMTVVTAKLGRVAGQRIWTRRRLGFR